MDAHPPASPSPSPSPSPLHAQAALKEKERTTHGDDAKPYRPIVASSGGPHSTPGLFSNYEEHTGKGALAVPLDPEASLNPRQVENLII